MTQDLGALSYLNGRGIDTATAEAYRLGYVGQPIEGHEPYKGMISIPYLRPAGVIAMKFRRLDNESPKYSQISGCGTHLYNTEILRTAGRMVGLCEGEFDAVVLSSLCGIPSVGIPGVSQWRANPHFAELFEGRHVLFFADIDRKEEGVNPGEKLAKEVVETLDSSRIVRLPEPDEGETKMDVTLCYLRYGRDEIRKRAGL